MDPTIAVVPTSATEVTLYDMGKNGNFLRTVQVTDGQIIGSSTFAGDTCSIVCQEKGRTCIVQYSMPRFQWKNKIYK